MMTIELLCSRFRSIAESNMVGLSFAPSSIFLGNLLPTPAGWDRAGLSRFYRKALTSSLGAQSLNYIIATERKRLRSIARSVGLGECYS
jgi:hypothetical protein